MTDAISNSMLALLQRRGQAATRLLQELNEEVTGNFIDEVNTTNHNDWAAIYRIVTYASG